MPPAALEGIAAALMTHAPQRLDQPATQEQQHARRGVGSWLRLMLWSLLVLLTVVCLTAWCWTLKAGAAATRPDLLQGGWLAIAGLCLALWLLLATTPTGAIRLSPRLSKRTLILLSALVAIAAVAWLRPVLSTEVLRYRFDGRAWLLAMSPYQVSPDEAEVLASSVQDAELRLDLLDRAAPDQQRTTLNLPVSQAAFVATRTLEYLSPQEEHVRPPFAPQTRAADADWRTTLLDLPWWRQMFFWRVLLAGVYLLTVAELIAWLRYRELSPWWAVVFAWQPLVVMEMLGAAHQDMIGVLFLIAGLRRADGGNMRRAAMCLAASVAVKPLAILAIPFVIRRAWREDGTEFYPPKRALAPPAGGPAARRLVIWFLATLVLLLAPLYSREALAETWRATSAYLTSPGQDAALWRVLDAVFGGPDASLERQLRVCLAAWSICAIATMVVGVIAWQRRVSPAAAMYAMLMTGLMLSPTMSPWLLAWPLAMVPVLRGRAGPAALVWAGTASLHYTAETMVGLAVATQALAWQIGPVVVVGALEGLLVGRRTRRLRAS